jgi:hypothetical protein
MAIEYEWSDPDAIWLTKNGWRWRHESFGSEIRWWNYKIECTIEPESWMTKAEAVKLQVKIFAGTSRW